MNIAIIDADIVGRKKHRFPNLACMKLSGYYKELGNDVILKLDYDNLDQYDKVFISKVFTDTYIDEEILNFPNVEYGGTGFFYDKAKPLPVDIEHHFPDYHLYDKWTEEKISNGEKEKQFEYYNNYSIGFTTRGCIRQCSFCVNKNYKQCNLHSPIEEFLDKNRKYICLLDDNVFACKDWKSVFDSLNNSGKRFQFKQGLDERLLTDEKCEILFNSKWIGDYIFAFDNIKDKDIIIKKLELIRKHTYRRCKFYVFCGYNHLNPEHYDKEFWERDIDELFQRIEILSSYQCLPYIMKFKDFELSPYRGTYINISAWCNQPNIFEKMTYNQFCEVDNKRKGGRSATWRYYEKLLEDYPYMKKYFDIKFNKIR